MQSIKVQVSRLIPCKDGTRKNIMYEKICEFDESLVFPFHDVRKALSILYGDKDVYITFEYHFINYQNK